MILADKILEERKKCGWSQEELAEKLGVSRQAVSKWEAAGSVPDLERIVRMAELFDVSTDYLLKDEMTREKLPAAAESSYDEREIYMVSMEEANDFIEGKRKSAGIVSIATGLCIISPVLMIILGTLSDDFTWMNEALAGGAGFVFLLGSIAFAVYLFIGNRIRQSHTEFLEKESFETAYGVAGMVKERRQEYEGPYTRGMSIGVIACILAVVPLVLAALAEAPDHILGLFTAFMLSIIAFGVNRMIYVSMIKAGFDTLLEEGDYSRSNKRAGKKTDQVSSIYWSLALALYLGYSFITGDWTRSWIVWPVAGVLYGAVSAFVRLIFGMND